jgi:hypothetical protein
MRFINFPLTFMHFPRILVRIDALYKINLFRNNHRTNLILNLITSVK